MSTYTQETAKFLGEEVSVTLDGGDSPVIVKGKLLSFTDDGQFVIQDECLTLHYCWPLLHIELLPEK
jgi:hypothetical protein